jgi:hypothetical protein
MNDKKIDTLEQDQTAAMKLLDKCKKEEKKHKLIKIKVVNGYAFCTKGFAEVLKNDKVTR